MIREKVTEKDIAYTKFIDAKDMLPIEDLIEEMYGDNSKEEHSYFDGEETEWDILYGYVTNEKGVLTFWNGTEDVIIKNNHILITNKEQLLSFIKGGF